MMPRNQIACTALAIVELLFVIGPLVRAQEPDLPRIHVWYGPRQEFGHLGEPQRWVNILGSVGRASSLVSLTASLNGNQEIKLSVGSDLHRLANSGDFNIELSWDTLKTGSNHLELQAKWSDGTQVHEAIELLVVRKQTWPLPYEVDFESLENLQDAVQIVDGHWKLTKQGVRTAEPYYDRVLSVGDNAWTNYEALVQFTIHGFTAPKPGPPTYNVTHLGIALRWRGHTRDGRQPSRRWHPLGAQGEFLVKPNLSECQWRVLPGPKGATYSKEKQSIQLGQRLWAKAQVATLLDGNSRYRFKLWPVGQTEPADWALEHLEAGKEDYPSGALCLVPHNTDVTFHLLRVTPIRKSD